MAVVVLGSINLDLIARIKRVPRAGETGLADAMSTSPGGKGANQALAARRMGAETVLLGMVGDDAFAMQALKYLRQDGVNLSRIGVHPEYPTGLAMIVVEDSGQNAITVVPGANRGLDDHVLRDLQEVLAPHDILVLQLEIPLDTVEGAIRLAQRVGARILLDPAPAVAHLPKSFYQVNVMMPNQFEAETLLDQPVTDVRSAKQAAQQLRGRGAQVAIVKLGDQGLVWATSRGIFYVPGEPVPAVDAVGAGDAFAGALAARLDAGDGIAEAIHVANVAAALSTTRHGAQPSFAYWDEVRARQ
ncbi:MAG: ribokinase [Firmicutes bacterium]|nr:ribokinase [Bacillota bacterium]